MSSDVTSIIQITPSRVQLATVTDPALLSSEEVLEKTRNWLKCICLKTEAKSSSESYILTTEMIRKLCELWIVVSTSRSESEIEASLPEFQSKYPNLSPTICNWTLTDQLQLQVAEFKKKWFSSSQYIVKLHHYRDLSFRNVFDDQELIGKVKQYLSKSSNDDKLKYWIREHIQDLPYFSRRDQFAWVKRD